MTREPSHDDTVGRVLKHNLCSGCGLCAALVPDRSVSMSICPQGYARPEVARPIAKHVDELIAAVCPGNNLDLKPEPDVRQHVLWGPIVKTRTGYSNDEALRFHASSGGGLSGLLVYLLQSKEVDFIVHTGASGDRAIANQTTISTTAEEIYKAAGSRYAPSSPLSDIDQLLKRDGRFAFVGKPCDVAALRALARHDPRVEHKVPFLISFFCAGIPSLHGAREILQQLGFDEHEVASFRYRGDGWPGYATATSHDGQQERMSYAQSWGSILSQHQQFRCKICPDGSGGFADVVFADAWVADADGYPSFSEADGQSLIVSRTGRGEQLIKRAVAAGGLTVDDCDPALIETMQPSQARRKRLILSRFAALLATRRKTPRVKGLRLTDAARSAGILPNIKSFLGLVRRVVMKRA